LSLVLKRFLKIKKRDAFVLKLYFARKSPITLRRRSLSRFKSFKDNISSCGSKEELRGSKEQRGGFPPSTIIFLKKT
jgi:hypothetical protein